MEISIQKIEKTGLNKEYTKIVVGLYNSSKDTVSILTRNCGHKGLFSTNKFQVLAPADVMCEYDFPILITIAPRQRYDTGFFVSDTSENDFSNELRFKNYEVNLERLKVAKKLPSFRIIAHVVEVREKHNAWKAKKEIFKKRYCLWSKPIKIE